jgi:hypothetical protein
VRPKRKSEKPGRLRKDVYEKLPRESDDTKKNSRPNLRQRLT